MKKSIFIVAISLLSQTAFAGFFDNVKNVLVLGVAAFMRRGDQQLFAAVERLHLEITTAQNTTPAEQQARLEELNRAHQAYMDFVRNHGGNLTGVNPTQANTLLAAAQQHVTLTQPARVTVADVADEVAARLSGQQRDADRQRTLNDLTRFEQQFRDAQNAADRRAAVTALRNYLNNDQITIEEYRERNRVLFRAVTRAQDFFVLQLVTRLQELFGAAYKRARE